jgi:hypothetical protein
MEAAETEVRRRLETDPHYPLGEHDAMKWAIAFRVIVERQGWQLPPEVSDGLMVGWFANCMASEEMRLTGGSFLNADGVQSILDGEMQAYPEFHR